MKVLLDTSVLVSGMLSDQVHHANALPWLAKAKAGTFEAVISGHSVAEIYAVLTRLPRRPRISPAEALQLIQQNITQHTLVTLSPRDYVELIEDLAKVGVAGGAVYDAVIAKGAELAKVDFLVTLNLGHFQQVWPSGANRIISPIATVPP